MGFLSPLQRGDIDSLRSPYGQPTAFYLRFASIPVARQARRGSVRSLAFLLVALSFSNAAPGDELKIEPREDRLVIIDGTAPVAEYVFKDEKILRPYLANVHAPGGTPVTRTHPPIPDQDATDHADMHPGIWFGFGDVSGHDFWRNKGRIVHERFVLEPAAAGDRVSVTSVASMQTESGEKIAKVLSALLVSRLPEGWRLDWRLRFTPQVDGFAFGDQEEMGFGVRLATPLTEKNGGLITNSGHLASAAATWGQPAEWCDYSKVIDDRRVGVLLVPDPANPHRSWWHNRDYGLMVANPFGRQAMKQGGASRIEVKKGESYSFNHSVYLYAIDREGKLAWERYLR
ncbi:MAG: PmoA family protein [Verrucomicrobiales bacterium]|nr:PmoA family protein [Verrucomicrobiales bacterium]